MRRLGWMLVILLSVGLSAAAEEVTLKDGTKIVGHMTAVTFDKIEVETSYGKVQLNRSDIVSISFPENGAAKGDEAAAPSKQELPKIDETLSGTQYVNRTGKFALTLPPDWKVDPNLRRSPGTLAGLSSSDKMRFAMVIQEEYPGSIESYKELTMLNVRRTLSNFEELSEQKVTIDGKPALVVFYRGNSAKTGNLPIEFVSAIVASGSSFTKVTAWCVEPLFHDMQPAFEKLVNSYRSTGPITAAASSAKP